MGLKYFFFLTLLGWGCKPNVSPLKSQATQFKQRLSNGHYFESCAQALGVSLGEFPQMDCNDLVEIPRYAVNQRDIQWAHQLSQPCLNPDSNFSNDLQKCNGAPVAVGTYFKINSSKAPVAFTLACTQGFRQVIAYRYDTGDTCFFSGGHGFSSEKEVAHWMQNLHQPSIKQSCASCHALGPFVRSGLILTENLEVFLGKDSYRKAILAKAPHHKEHTSFLEAPPDPSALAQAMGGQPHLLVHGVPQNIYKKSPGLRYERLRYRIVEKSLLESQTSVEAWNPALADHPGVAACSGCHALMATPHGAAMAAQAVGACGPGTKGSALCLGFQREGFKELASGTKTPHGVFTKVDINPKDQHLEAIYAYGTQCQRRSRGQCAPISPGTSKALEGESLFFEKLKVEFHYHCQYTQSALSWVPLGSKRVLTSPPQWVPFLARYSIEADKSCHTLMNTLYPKRPWVPVATTPVLTGAQVLVTGNHCLEATPGDYSQLQRAGLPPLSPLGAFPPPCP